MANQKNSSPIIIKREEVAEEGAHGGGWKVAYADFMTAMMAFFLLMWLLNVTTDEQRRGIALFFNPMADKTGTATPSQSIKEATPLSDPSDVVDNSEHEPNDENYGPDAKDKARPSDGNAPSVGSSLLTHASNDFSQGIKANVPPQAPAVIPLGGPQSGAAQKEGQVGQGNADRLEQISNENEKLQETVSGLRDALQKSAHLKTSEDNLSFKIGSDEIRVEIQDTNHQSMFNVGATAPNKTGVAMLTEIAKWLSSLPEDISIIGQTDGLPYHARKVMKGRVLSNWTLSVMRADKAREVLVKAGYPDRKIKSVTGQADRGLANPSDPKAVENRRIVIVIHRRHPLPRSFLSSGSQQKDAIERQNVTEHR